uniref:NADH-ubiquinone oxidoreductase chain 6 n=1 Tax=Cephalcia infumata TaxID=2048903 RepID=A0A8H2SJ30_9HYME|nr:NADH dehydrogenase subunit 6 [Cephalcia infumata]
MSIIFMLIKHPLSMMIIIIIYTINICMMVGLINKTFWFSYILFLIMLGGMMILFMYMTNLISNKIIKFNFLMFIMFLLILMFMNMIFIYIYNDYYLNFYLNMNNKEMIKLNYNLLMNFELNMYINKIFMTNYNYISLMLISYLFINLIAIVKIINIKKGPLRIINN